eukprot:TRINITY_DN71963_c0_g1_i1.p1 TRINITY_DN71963_c0_g1~~TRINITY_DN71963_c0_g1_i1.p1  ORF type:complete len:362 (+),score=22.57 TRINITY_DN71963_c0_g1_i1:113-1087(+)
MSPSMTQTLTEPMPPADPLDSLEIGLGLAVVCVTVAIVLLAVWCISRNYRARAQERYKAAAASGEPEKGEPGTRSLSTVGNDPVSPASGPLGDASISLSSPAAPAPHRKRARRRAESVQSHQQSSAAGSPAPRRSVRRRGSTMARSGVSLGRRRGASVSPASRSLAVEFADPESMMQTLREASRRSLRQPPGDPRESSGNSNFEEHLNKVVSGPETPAELPALGAPDTIRTTSLLALTSGRGRARRRSVAGSMSAYGSPLRLQSSHRVRTPVLQSLPTSVGRGYSAAADSDSDSAPASAYTFKAGSGTVTSSPQSMLRRPTICG